MRGLDKLTQGDEGTGELTCTVQTWYVLSEHESLFVEELRLWGRVPCI